MITYTSLLTNWHQGTGGGSSLSTMFEGWSDCKLERLGVDVDNYDHTDVAARPAVMIAGYAKQRVPYMTIIHLWDKTADYLLSSCHDPYK